ncbi:ATP synthase regulation protein NCA2-domain-containing protein [Phascolomyces articulosus]|uniref:ATP synthase regulation protein NCA2-domain-containing protein n=1 Tax=Phascolomyces articulosus TaxID=60185 RepID=A0AAD5KHP0_9FUNG|nr:ATP synthase regulation protein NCA2-domain-containing protein [Phascolomyces articulosus]
MSTFVNEHIAQLNHSLSTIFQQQEYVRAENITDPETALKQDDPNLFLTLASQGIDLSHPTLPNVQTVKKYLDLYTSSSTNTFLTSEQEGSPLEWAFITKCAVAVYGVLLDRVLNSTLPLSESVNYWNSVYGSSLNEAYYALQTAPVRAVSLATRTINTMRTTQLGLGSVLQSPDHIISSLFPNRARTKSAIRHSLELFSPHRPLLAQLIHEEIGHKKKMLESLRTQQATRLGLLMKMTPQFTVDRIPQDTERCVKLMEYIMEPFTTNFNDASTAQQQHIDTTITTPVNVQYVIDSMNNILERSTTYAIANRLSKMIDDLTVCHENLNAVHELYQPPSALVRYWIPALVLYIAGNTTMTYVFNRRDALLTWFHELGDTACDFAINWIWEPVLKVWETIRLKDQRLGVLSKEGLRSDLDSLERMVLQFASTNYHLSESEAQDLIAKVRDGDLSVVLKAYENEIKHPLKNAITGDLIQTLLIQVQKTKVDVDLAMAALDKLLKSNELNFAFLAVAPSMLLTWAFFAWLKNVYSRRTGHQVGKIAQPIREAMRRVERLFNLASVDVKPEEEQLDCESHGILICEIHLLRIYALQLPRRHSIRDHFMEDLRDLENPKLTVAQKLNVVTRMSRSWDFLQPSRGTLNGSS